MKKLPEKAAANLISIRRNKPLVHNITNFVVMNYTANALLAAGASPVMAHAPNEVEDMVKFAGALVLNIGTLTDEWINSMLIAGACATALKKPVILDPVGAGATRLRTDSSLLLIDKCRISVVRGNASEILALAHQVSATKGVDSADSVESASGQARTLATEKQTVVAITGPVDFVTDGSRIARVSNGHPLMGKITGTGCTATAIIGAFCAVDSDPFSAAIAALAYFGLAGEIAAHRAQSPGSFAVALLDALYEISPEQLADMAKIELE
jgi:hydroxyethylthiazole kinase